MSYTATQFYEDELNRLNAKNENAKSILNSQDRLAKLNDSYRKRYAKYVEILVVLIIAYTLRLGIILLRKYFPTIPLLVVDIVTTLLIFAVSYYLFNAFWELNTRSNINYDEIEIPAYDSSGVNVSDIDENGRVSGSGNSLDTCIGEQCCPGRFDTENQICNNIPAATTQPPVQTTTQPPASPFTTLENVANNLPFNSPELKRESTMNVKPSEHTTSLNYSKV
jgi:hypothetical protein